MGDLPTGAVRNRPALERRQCGCGVVELEFLTGVCWRGVVDVWLEHQHSESNASKESSPHTPV